MKQMYLLALLLFTSAASFAFSTTYNVSQTNWRWRNNDGGEATATWKADQNTAISYKAADGVLRLRMEIINTSYYGNNPSSPAIIGIDDSLQYSTTPADASSWTSIGRNLSKPFVVSKAGGYIVSGQPTTEQLTDSSYTFGWGITIAGDSILVMSIDTNTRTEVEWTLTGTSQLLPNTTYYFRQKQNRIGYNYLQYPSLSTSSVLPVTLTRFMVNPKNGTVQASWSVAPGDATSSFVLQRSIDGQTWTTVQTVNTSNAAAYTAYDNHPFKGVSVYYRLQLSGKDGVKSYSEIREITLPAERNMASVVPNPAHDVATLQFTGVEETKYGVTVMDVTGKTVLYKEGTAMQGNNQVKLDVKTLAKGMYFIRLVNGDSVQNLKLVKGE